MSVRQPEQEREDRRAELAARLREMTEERKAELARSDSAPPVAPVEKAPPVATTPEPSVASTPEPADAPSPPPPEASAPQSADTPVPQPANAPNKQPADEVSAVEAPTRRPLTEEPSVAHEPIPEVKPVSSTAAARTGRAGAGFLRASAGLLKLGSRMERFRPNRAAAKEGDESRPVTRRVRRAWSLPAILIGLALAGAIALWQLGGTSQPAISDGALSAAETAGENRTATRGSPSDERTNLANPEPEVGEAGVAELGSEVASAVTSVDETWTPPPPAREIAVEIADPEAGGISTSQVSLDLAQPTIRPPEPVAGQASKPDAADATERPTLFAYEVAPKLENPGEIRRALQNLYPTQLRNAGVEGTVVVRVFVDETGAVAAKQVTESSGYELMDEAALEAADRMRFSPAMNRDKRTSVWLELPITFR